MNPSHVTVSVALQADGRPKGFVLAVGSESVALEPGRTWTQTDRFKWVTRGLIEPPQSFAVHPDGSVDLNGETYRPEEPGHANALSDQINKHHVPPPVTSTDRGAAHKTSHPTAELSRRVRFRVHLDPRSHVLIEAIRGAERTETGLRGLSHLAADGWMLRPRTIHVDPLQRYLELDGIRYPSDPAGVQELEKALNERYAAEASAGGNVAVEVRENAGASTGFDIHFWMVRAGTRFEIKGHLSQDKLDILQDHEKCGLLQPGIILRISPPFLYFRRRRADGGEEPVPGIPDVKYRAISAPELQRLLNHPAIRASSAGNPTTEVINEALPSDITAVRLTRHAHDARHVWIELHRMAGEPLVRAFTHHNVADLQSAGLFRTGIEILLSIDHQHVVITDPAEPNGERRIPIGTEPTAETLETISRAITDRLRPAVPVRAPAVEPAPTETEPSTPPPLRATEVRSPELSSAPGSVALKPTGPNESPAKPRSNATAEPAGKAGILPPPPARPAKAEQPDDPVLAGLFAVTDPQRINVEIFRQLAERLHLAPQDVLLSLPRVFDDREFEILAFTPMEISSVLQLRGNGFYGFYLTHLGENRSDLVYACHGTHLEWGTQKCAVQPHAGSETLEVQGAALRGLAQNADNHFVFIVEPKFREFIRNHEKACNEAFAHFLTIREWAERRAEFPLLWPVAL